MMKSVLLYIAALFVLVGGMTPTVAGIDFSGARVNGGIGGIWPQGSFESYAEPGFNAVGRISLDIPPTQMISAWTGLSLSAFTTEESIIPAGEYFAGPAAAEREIDRWAGTIHLGLQAGSRRGIVRPRVAAGLGWSLFFTATKVSEVRTVLQGETPASVSYDDVQGRFGWRGLVGCDIVISTTWGISLDFLYDAVWRLRRSGGLESSVGMAQYLGFAVGVVIPFESFAEKIKRDEWEPKDIPRDRDDS